MGNNNAETQLLRDPDTYPSDEVLASALGKSYTAYEVFAKKLPDYGIGLEWRYYNDGKAWLGKCCHKKKTVFWLSVWEGFFRVTLFFTEKTRAGVEALPVSDDIKTQLTGAGAIGKLIPLVIAIRTKKSLDDVFALIAYKQSLK